VHTTLEKSATKTVVNAVTRSFYFDFSRTRNRPHSYCSRVKASTTESQSTLLRSDTAPSSELALSGRLMALVAISVKQPITS
jgi:hypothetical protein